MEDKRYEIVSRDLGKLSGAGAADRQKPPCDRGQRFRQEERTDAWGDLRRLRRAGKPSGLSQGGSTANRGGKAGPSVCRTSARLGAAGRLAGRGRAFLIGRSGSEFLKQEKMGTNVCTQAVDEIVDKSGKTPVVMSMFLL